MQMHPHPHTDIHIHLVIADLEGRSKLHDKVAATSTPQTWVGYASTHIPRARAHTHTHTHMHTPRNPARIKRWSLYTRVHTHVRTCTLSLSQIHICPHTDTDTRKQTDTLTERKLKKIPPAWTMHRTYMPTHTHTHTCPHRDTHTKSGENTSRSGDAPDNARA
jgi:hypothetical protein